MRWLAGVCLGAVGRYRTAARWLAPGGEPAGSLAASCLASHLRQLGRHAEAEPLDRLALSITTDPEARADLGDSPAHEEEVVLPWSLLESYARQRR